MKQLVRIILIAFLVASCAPKSAEQIDAMMLSKIDKKEASQPLKNTAESDVNKKKIIKDGRLGMDVKNLSDSKTNIDTIVRNLGGYYDNESLSNNDYATAYDLKIRIPSDKFEILIAKIESGEGEVSYKDIDARDVTEEFIDLETRLAFQEQALLELSDALAAARSEEAGNALRLHRALEELRQLRSAMAASPVTGDAASEPPPPHY